MGKNNKKNNNRTNNQHRAERSQAAQPREKKVNPNEIKAVVAFNEGVAEKVAEEILNVLKKTMFNKLSYPIGTYRSYVDDSVDNDDTRITTIGYVRNYDAENEEFTIILFPKFTDIIKDMGEIGVEVLHTINKRTEGLGSITRFNIVPCISVDTSEGCDESAEETEPEE